MQTVLKWATFFKARPWFSPRNSISKSCQKPCLVCVPVSDRGKGTCSTFGTGKLEINLFRAMSGYSKQWSLCQTVLSLNFKTLMLTSSVEQPWLTSMQEWPPRTPSRSSHPRVTRYIHSTLLGISLTSLTGTGQFLLVRFGPGSDLEALLPGPLAGDSELGIATVTRTTRVGQACRAGRLHHHPIHCQGMMRSEALEG